MKTAFPPLEARKAGVLTALDQTSRVSASSFLDIVPPHIFPPCVYMHHISNYITPLGHYYN